MSKKALKEPSAKFALSKKSANLTPSETANRVSLLGTRVRAELENITRLNEELVRAEEKLTEHRKEIAMRALLVGAILCQVKLDLGHGAFGPFKAEHFGSATNRQAIYYMRLAEVFFKLEGVLMPEVIALPQTSLDLASSPEVGSDTMQKARKFVGNRNLNQLLELHGLKVRGGYHPSETAVQKWLADHHPKQAGKTYAELSEDQQLAYQQSGYNEKDWRTPEEIRREEVEAAQAALRSPVTTLVAELERTEWRQHVSPADLTALRRELQDAMAKVDLRIAEMNGTA